MSICTHCRPSSSPGSLFSQRAKAPDGKIQFLRRHLNASNLSLRDDFLRLSLTMPLLALKPSLYHQGKEIYIAVDIT